MSRSKVDMAGNNFGGTIALRPIGPDAKTRAYWWTFRCSCGQEFDARGAEVRRGKIKRCPQCARQAGLAAVTTHGLTRHALYGVWCAMKGRCENPSAEAYADYGGRGIKVCDRWRSSFEAFLIDMGERPSPKHTLERSDNDGHYEPGNVVWATRLQQANNKRSNRRLCIEGATKTLAEWGRESGLGESAIRARLRRGVSGAQILAPSSLSKLTFQGQTRTLAEWAATTGIKKGTLSSRLYVYGWDLPRALTTKVTP